MLNSIVLMGRLTADPELKTTNSGLNVTSFTLAVERNYSDRSSGERQTDFIDIVAWRGTAEFVCRYFRKGQLVAIHGSLQSRKWQDRDGNNRTSWEVMADQVFFAEPKRTNDAPREVMNRADTIGAPLTSHSSETDFIPMPDDDLPF